MKACPNCRRLVTAESAVCECGELLRAEVTHVQPWETETVFGARPVKAYKRNIAVVAVLAIALTAIGTAWLGMRQNLLSVTPGNSDDPSTSMTSSRSDSESHDEDLTPSSLSSQEGVFVFSSGTKPPPHDRTGSLVRVQRSDESSTPTDPNSAAVGPLEQKPLAGDKETANISSENKQADCKPDLALKKPRPPVAAPTDPKPTAPRSAETSSRTYILGPRGGCFFVAPGGAKKYVDHSLCPQTTAAARQ